MPQQTPLSRSQPRRTTPLVSLLGHLIKFYEALFSVRYGLIRYMINTS